jgi:hypothetical protein
MIRMTLWSYTTLTDSAQTRKGRADAAKRASMIAAIGAWLVRLVGGGGGI